MYSVAVCMVALAFLLVAEGLDWRWGGAVAKLTAASAFVSAAAGWGPRPPAMGSDCLSGCSNAGSEMLSSGQTLWFQLGI